MLCDINEFLNYFEKTITRCIDKREKYQQVELGCLQKHDIPIDITANILNTTKNICEFGESGIFYAYCILEAIRDLGDVVHIGKYFTKPEIENFSREKYQNNTDISFPIRFKCVKVSDDQWIGSIDAQTLVNLGRNNLIRYNIETQRTMHKIVKGESVKYKITIDKTALRQIKEMFENDTYIPNTITLNIPEGSGDFYYDDKKSELVINQIDKFDITDGYHRYQALISVIASNPKYNCKLELRIQNFGVDKADSFIWQEDKKTKMKKVDSESYNMNESANRVTKRINDSSDSNLHGLISRSNGLINYGWFASCIRYYYFKGNKPENENLYIINISKKLINFFNYITENEQSLLTHEWSFLDMAILFYLETTNQDNENIINLFHGIKNYIIKNAGTFKSSNTEMKKTTWNTIDKAAKEVTRCIMPT